MKKMIIKPKINEYYNRIILEKVQPRPEEFFMYYRTSKDRSCLRYNLMFECAPVNEWWGRPHICYIELNERSDNLWGSYYEKVYIPLTMSKDPTVLCNTDDLPISPKDILESKTFIKNNLIKLLKVTEGKPDFTWEDFNDTCLPITPTITENIHQKKYIYCEMANLFPKDTGLKNIIWVDDSNSYTHSGHWNRIKIQNDYVDHVTGNWMSMSLFGKKDLYGNQKVNISNKDLERARLFIDYNFNNLTDKNAAANFQNSDIVKIGKNDEPIYPHKNSPYEYKIKGDIGCGCKLVQAKNSLLNIIDSNNKLLSPNEWFKDQTYFQNNVIDMQRLDGSWVRMDVNGKIIGVLSVN